MVTPLTLHASIRFRLGRQEDAHEYLRCVLDAMHEAFLKHIKPKPPPELASTTFIHRIFGGKLRSEVGGCCCELPAALAAVLFGAVWACVLADATWKDCDVSCCS